MRDISPRVKKLITEMTWQEKLGQLQIVFRPHLDAASEVVRGGIGSVFWPRSAAAVNTVQRVAVEETRLGIPLLIGLDVIHGHRTIGPVPIGMAASFDSGLVRELAHLAAIEARSGGVTWTFSPMADIARDPRWGRTVEGFGEDVHLTIEMTRAMIRGYQGQSLAAPDALAATAKHFVAYGQPEGGRDYNTVDVSEHRLRNVYLEPFLAAVEEKVAAVMASFNTIGGHPMHANAQLLTGVLKEEWGFEGITVGDADGVRNLLPHRVAESLGDAVRLAYHAGLDVEMGGLASELADEELTSELLDPARVDDAVERVLALKESLGLFDNPYVPEAAERMEPTDESRGLVRRAAARSSVLLKNDGTLPLTAPKRVLLSGPYAESIDHLGAWTQSFASPARSIVDEFRARCHGADVRVVPGVGFFDEDAAGIEVAVSASEDRDLVVLFVGEPSTLTGEAASRSDLRLPGTQEQLIAAVAATGVPFVVVLETGRPLVVSNWIDLAPTVVLAWHGGTEAAGAIVDILFGDEDPAGRLPISFPRSVGQVPIYYSHENTGRPATTGGQLVREKIDIGLHGPDNTADDYTSKYLDLELGPQFEFGHGGGYAQFRYSSPRLSDTRVELAALSEGADVSVSIEVSNISSRRGDDVIMVFVEDLVASVAPPVRRLVGFARVTVEPSQSAAVTFDLSQRHLGYWRAAGSTAEFVVEPGVFRLHVGPTLADTHAVELIVSG